MRSFPSRSRPRKCSRLWREWWKNERFRF